MEIFNGSNTYEITWWLKPHQGLTYSTTTNRDYHAQITKGKNGEYSQYNIHNVININKAINDNIHTWEFLMGPMPMELHGG